MDRFQTLKSSFLFASLDRSILWRIADLAQEKIFQANEYLFHEGQEADYCYLINSGRVQVIHPKKNFVIAEVQAGEIIGELAIIDGLPRSASVITLDVTHTLMISAWDFKAQMQAYPEIALQLLPVIAKRLRHTQNQLAEHYS